MGLLCGRKEFHIHRLFSDPMDCSAPGFPVLHRLLEFCSNSCPLSRCYPASHALLSPSFPALNLYSIRGFSNESDLHYRRPKYWSFSFSISPSSAYSGLTSFRTDLFDLLAVQGTQESSPTPQFKSINSSVLSFIYVPTLTSVHDYWKDHSFE